MTRLPAPRSLLLASSAWAVLRAAQPDDHAAALLDPFEVAVGDLALTAAQVEQVRSELTAAGVLTAAGAPVDPVRVALGALHADGRLLVTVAGTGGDGTTGHGTNDSAWGAGGAPSVGVWGADGLLGAGAVLRPGASDGDDGVVELTLCGVEDLVALVRAQLGHPVTGDVPGAGAGRMLAAATLAATVAAWQQGRADLAGRIAGDDREASELADLTGDLTAVASVAGSGRLLLFARGSHAWWTLRLVPHDGEAQVHATAHDESGLRRVLVELLAPVVDR